MSARDDLVNGLTEHACCFSEEDAQRMADAFAHELAEKIRTTVPPTAITPGGPYTDGVTWAADLIDPAKGTPR
jgi:hypothetical protein